MPSTQQNRPVVTILPSSQEEVKAYMAAIRLASSVRNKMDAEKAGAAGEEEKIAVNADANGPHHPNLPPPPPADLANPGGRESVPILNQTSSALSISNNTKPGFVHPRDSYPSSGHSMDTGTWSLREMMVVAAAANQSTEAKVPTGPPVEAPKQYHGHLPPPKVPMGTGTVLENAAADSPTRVELDALEQHQGRFPPPEPPVSSTPAPPGEVISRRTGPLPVDLNQDPLPYKWNVSGSISPQCKLYVTNTDVNVTFIACPATKTTDNNNSTHDLASRQLQTSDLSSSHILAIRNTAMCEAPASFNQRVACGNYDGWFVLGFFILFAMIVSAWIKVRKQHTTQRLDEEENENEGAAQLRFSHVLASTNAAEAKLREEVRKGNKEDHGMDEKLSTEQYEPVAWRCASYRAARANVEGKVSHDAVPVADLPRLFV